MFKRQIQHLKTIPGVLTLAIVFFCGGFAHAQSDNGELQLSAEFFLAKESAILFLSDFNITQSGSSAPLFRITLNNKTESDLQVVLSFSLTSAKYNSANLIEAKTLPFTLSPAAPRSLTNLDMTNNTFPDIRLDYFRYDSQVASELQTAVLQSGKLPNDTYILNIVLEQAGVPDNHVATQQVIDIRNLTTIDLINPGQPAQRGECVDMFSPLPQFQWQSNADKFILTVCEALPTNSSPEDVMQNEPRARLTLARDVDFFGIPSIIYPSSGVWPLQEGKTYYWQVLAIAESPSGELQLPSEIWCFRIPRLDDPNRQIMDTSVRNALTSALAGSPFADLLSTDGPLKGFFITGTVLLNGRRIEVSDLNALLTSLLSGNKEIVEVTIE